MSLKQVRQQQQLADNSLVHTPCFHTLKHLGRLFLRLNSSPVAHSLDLELSDEPLYLAASTHLQLGMLFQRQDKLQEAEQQYRSSLKVFPRFVAALSALGQVGRCVFGGRVTGSRNSTRGGRC